MPTTIPTTTSSTRPGSPSTGDAYFETDTNKYIIYDGANWRAYNSDGASIPGVTNGFSGLFDGTDDYIEVGNITNLNSGTNFTISVWFKRAARREDTLLGGAGGVNGIGMYPWIDGTFYAHVGSSGTVSATLPGENQWINAVVTRDASSTILYFNGILADSATSTASIPATSGNAFRIGDYASYTPKFLGNIDEVSIWDSTTLDANNVGQIYNAGTPINLASNAGDYTQSSNLTHWYRLGDNASDTGSGGSPANGDTITNIENAANSGTNDGSTINGDPAFSSLVP
jgi:hypothetical protein